MTLNPPEIEEESELSEITVEIDKSEDEIIVNSEPNENEFVVFVEEEEMAEEERIEVQNVVENNEKGDIEPNGGELKTGNHSLAGSENDGSALSVQSSFCSLENHSHFDSLTSCRVFQNRSISASIIRSINMFRATNMLKVLEEDPNLTHIAMRHSYKMATKRVEVNTVSIKRAIRSQPLVVFDAFVSHYPSMNNAFTTAVNNWTSDSNVSSSLMARINCIGVGFSISEDGDSYFTLIIGLRSDIGSSGIRGAELKSLILAEKCLYEVNKIRKEFKLLPMLIDRKLCSLAFTYCSVPRDNLSTKYVTQFIGPTSSINIGYGSIFKKNGSVKNIIEEWMTQVTHVDLVLGDYNRIGIGFMEKDDQIRSIRIVIRDIHAAIIDGTETLIDPIVISKLIAEKMNEFREQHHLEKLDLDEDLFSIARDHTEFIANGSIGPNPLESDMYVNEIEPVYEAIDVSHTCCCEMSRSPKAFMQKWRNNTDCVSVLLNQVDRIGIGLCFDSDYICHITVIIAALGSKGDVVNKIVKL